MNSRVSALQTFVDRALEGEAAGVEVLVDEATGHRVESVHGRVADETTTSRSSMVVRVWLNGGREGEASGRIGRSDKLLDLALQRARASDPDPMAGPVARLVSTVHGLGLEDRRWDQVQETDRTDVVRSAIRGVRAVEGLIQIEGFSYEDERTYRAFVNSKGVALEQVGTNYWVRGEVSADFPEGELRLNDVVAARTFASAASLPFGQNLARRTASLFGDPVSMSDLDRFLLPSRAIARIVRRLAPLFTLNGMNPKTCFLANTEASRFGRRFHLLDDGALPGALRTMGFDDHGVPPVPLTLIRDGVVDRLFLSPREARIRGTRPTGHVVGGELRPSNLLVKPGTRSANAILTEIGGRTFVVDVLPEDFTLNLKTGAFSAVVAGRVLDGAKVQGPVRGVRLSGNLVDVFGQIVDLTSNTDRIEHIDAPGIIVRGFDVDLG